MAVIELPPNVQCTVYINTLTLNQNYTPTMAVRIKDDGGEYKSIGDPFPLPRPKEADKIVLPIKMKKFFLDLTVPGENNVPVSHATRSPAEWRNWEVSRDPMFVIVWEDDDTGHIDAYKDNDIVAAISCPKKT